MNTFTLPVIRPGLARFTTCDPGAGSSRLGVALTVAAALVTVAAGAGLMKLPLPAPDRPAPGESAPVHLRLEAVAAPRPAPPEPQVVPVLEGRTLAGAAVDRPAAAPTADQPPVPVETEPAPAQVPPRRVYGVRKVYAQGLGAGGQEAGGLVTRLGNSLGGAPDTLTATAADLQGRLAPLSTVDQAPEPQRRVKPEYSAAMRRARAEGVVAAYLLVDADGSVRDVRVIEDFGLDSAEVAAAALARFRFRPARRAGQPVAVWILHRIRFEFQE